MEKALQKFLTVVFTVLILFLSNTGSAQDKNRMVRVAKIEIDSAFIDEYKLALQVHSEAALKNEPGVLALYSMAEKQNPNRIMVLEIYASKEAYQSHLKTEHFIKYKTSTLKMVKSLELIDVDPIVFMAQPGLLGNKK